MLPKSRLGDPVLQGFHRPGTIDDNRTLAAKARPARRGGPLMPGCRIPLPRPFPWPSRVRQSGYGPCHTWKVRKPPLVRWHRSRQLCRNRFSHSCSNVSLLTGNATQRWKSFPSLIPSPCPRVHSRNRHGRQKSRDPIPSLCEGRLMLSRLLRTSHARRLDLGPGSGTRQYPAVGRSAHRNKCFERRP